MTQRIIDGVEPSLVRLPSKKARTCSRRTPVAPLGLELRVGVHTCEGEHLRGVDLGGLAVPLAARVMLSRRFTTQG